MTKWTADDIPAQQGRTFVVTGANSGLGLQTTIALTRKGAHVVMACRDAGRARQAQDAVTAAVPGASTEVVALDLADLASVRSFPERLDHDQIDVLINNAGVMALPRRETADGFEMQFGTNHLGHFALTALLIDRVLRSDDPRVVTLSSNAHKMGRMRFDDLQHRQKYFRWTVYGQSKLANLLFALELQRRADAAGLPLRSLAAHPGYASTHLQLQANNITGLPIDKVINRALNRVVAQSDAMGALPSLYAATVPDIPGGAYVGPDGAGEFRGHPQLVSPTSRATDAEDARRLWAASEELTGVRFELTPAAAPA